MNISVDGHADLRLGFNFDRIKELRGTQVTQLGLEMSDTPLFFFLPLCCGNLLQQRRISMMRLDSVNKNRLTKS